MYTSRYGDGGVLSPGPDSGANGEEKGQDKARDSEAKTMKYFAEKRHTSLAELYDEALTVTQDAIMADGISIFELSASGATLEFVATKTIARDLLKGLKLRIGTGIVGQAAASAQGVISNDVSANPDFFALPDQALKFRTKSVLCCPMRHAGEVIGAIELINKVDGTPFVLSELRSTQAVADGVAPNWRSEARASRRETFHELGALLRRVVEVEGISVFTIDAQRENLHLRFSDTARKIHLKGAKLNVHQGVAGQVAREGKSVLVEDVHQEPRFFKGVDAVSMFSTKSIIAVPVASGRRVLGVLEVVNARGSEPFHAGDLRILEEIAAELAGKMFILL